MLHPQKRIRFNRLGDHFCVKTEKRVIEELREVLREALGFLTVNNMPQEEREMLHRRASGGGVEKRRGQRYS